MANVNDLLAVPAQPKTMEEWLGRFSLEDRAVVVEAMLTRSPAALMPVLTELDDNPYPFQRNTLSAWRLKYKDSNDG